MRESLETYNRTQIIMTALKSATTKAMCCKRIAGGCLVAASMKSSSQSSAHYSMFSTSYQSQVTSTGTT